MNSMLGQLHVHNLRGLPKNFLIITPVMSLYHCYKDGNMKTSRKMVQVLTVSLGYSTNPIFEPETHDTPDLTVDRHNKGNHQDQLLQNKGKPSFPTRVRRFRSTESQMLCALCEFMDLSNIDDVDIFPVARAARGIMDSRLDGGPVRKAPMLEMACHIRNGFYYSRATKTEVAFPKAYHQGNNLKRIRTFLHQNIFGFVMNAETAHIIILSFPNATILVYVGQSGNAIHVTQQRDHQNNTIQAPTGAFTSTVNPNQS
ncbi:hypothetical protein CC78DRAFT_617286 [Lojkania enalia]|uniref:Uncharacterized protein n=1 Tax=Lojkania enalia TaxID=147567 RepID=A0A9P4K8Y3_9PLEO|nr:hypothetical protein CC78DRAFT_617286 [Didymosphaeria enalia]